METASGMRKTPVVLGVLNIVFGSLMAAWGLWSMISLFITDLIFGTFSGFMKMLPRAPGAPDLTAMYGQMHVLVKEMRPYFAVMLAVKVALSMALVWIGWGLYRRRSEMRRLAVWWAFAALACLVGELAFQLAIYVPRALALFDDFYKSMPMGEMQRSIQHVTMRVGVFFGVAFNAV